VTLHELAFDSMGTRVRLLASDPARLPAARAEVERLAARLTRFDPGSELSLLNADPRAVVPASADLRAAVTAALAGAALTGGLYDPTLLGALERAGYARSRTGHPRASLATALRRAPRRHPAGPDPAQRWRRVHVDDERGTVARPTGLRLDLGGSAKGFIADRAAALLAPAGPCAADCGGDIRVHGEHAIQVQNPFGGTTTTLTVHDAAIATSGIDTRLWHVDRRPGDDPRPGELVDRRRSRPGDPRAGVGDRAERQTERHHLIDPSTHAPAWTGVVAATARAATAAEAEALAKAALLRGPVAGPALLAGHDGGVIVADDGTVILTDHVQAAA
jgi:thiamine biosynthesis lipoprotein